MLSAGVAPNIYVYPIVTKPKVSEAYLTKTKMCVVPAQRSGITSEDSVMLSRPEYSGSLFEDFGISI